MTATLVIGPGRAGRTLALVHARAGDATFLLGRSSGEWQSWAAEQGIQPLLESNPEADAARRIVFAVPDPDLEDAAMETASRLDGGEGRAVVHASGIHGLAPLAPFSTLGAATGALHPLLPFAETPDPGGLAGGLATLLAAAPDREAILECASAWGVEVLTLENEGDRAAYHLALSLAANHVTATVGWAEDLLSPSLGPRAREAVLGLARAALSEVEKSGAGVALTGPVARGDEDTLALHLAALDSSQRRRYAGTLENVIALAEASGRLESEQAARLRHIADLPS